MIRKLLYFVRSLFLNFFSTSKEGYFATVSLFDKMTESKTILDGKVKYLVILLFSVFTNSVSGQCVSNLIKNGDFSGITANWSKAASKGTTVEVLTEDVYFSNGNTDRTAELDSEASLQQTVTGLVANTSYTLTFLYAKRPGAPTATVPVNIKISGGFSGTTSFSTGSVDTPQIGTFTFTPTSSSVTIEFFNSLTGTATLGTIIDNIVLVPSTQVTPIATTTPKGVFKTLTSCLTASVVLDVDNITDPSVTYSWIVASTPTSGVTFTPSANVKSPTVTFSTTGLREFKVTATKGTCSSTSSIFVNVVVPVVYDVTGGGAYCSGAAGVLVGLSNSDSGISYQLKKDGSNIGSPVTTSGGVINFGLQTAGTYTVVATNSIGCISNMNGSVVVTASTPPTASITGNSNICVSSTTTLSPTSGGTWVSNNPGIASVNPTTGVVTGSAAGTATFTFSSSASPNCTATTGAVTVSSGTPAVFNSSGSYIVPLGVTSLQIECWGAGGAGGNRNGAASGGGGGAYTKGILTSLTSGQSLTVTVGTGGTLGINGGSSNVSTIVANGGSSINSTTIRTGGSGGSASTITGSVIASYSGYDGGNAAGTLIGGSNEAGGGGGGSATVTGLGGTAGANGTNLNSTALTAGGTGTGNGGGGGATDGNPDAVAGIAPGGGGGGRGEGGGSSKSGANGRVTITIIAPTASAGGSETICQTGTATVIGASATNGTILWSHNGTGSLSNATTLTPTYTVASGDVGKTVTLTMTVSNGPCLTATATYTVIVKALPTISTQPQPLNICENQNGSFTVVTSAASPTYLWEYSADGLTNWLTTNGVANVTGYNTATLSLTTTPFGYNGNYVRCTITSGGCPIISNIAKLTVSPLPTANAGAALTAICQGATSEKMNGSVGGGAGGGKWAGGAGTWTNETDPVNATYKASASESGNITLTLTTNGGSCGVTTASKTITVNPLPTANAGGVLAAICQGVTSGKMNGSIGGGATGGKWTGGAGTWTNDTDPVNATYKAGTSESGSITLTLTTIGGSCGITTVTKTITVNPLPTANAGAALASICQGATSEKMNGSIGGGAGGGKWTGGAGTWTNETDPVNATYKASASESGNITLTLTTNGGSCGVTTASKTITVNPLPTANAGGVLAAICQGVTSGKMNGSIGGGATGGKWTGGAGTWTNDTDPVNATYKAGASESGSITLTLTTIGGSCGITTVTKTITVNPLPTANAGVVLASICQGATSEKMNGSIGGGATAGKWTGGAGTWTNDTDPVNATYKAGVSESGNITLTLTTSGGSCGITTVSKTITVNPNLSAVSITPNTGQAFCSVSSGTLLTVAETGGTTITSRQWGKRSVTGGTITPLSGSTAPTFTPSGANLGVGNWFVVCTSTPSCGSPIVSNEVAVSVSPDIAANVSIVVNPTGTICAGTSVTFTAFAANEGTSPLYQWYNGTTAISGATSSNYTSTALANADAIKVVMTSNASPCLSGSPATSNTITMSVNALPGTPIPGTPTQPTCASSVGTIPLSNLPSTGTWTITQGGTVSKTYSGTGSTYDVQNLTPGNYNFTVKGAANTCNSLTTGNVNIKIAVAKTWTGIKDNNWSDPANWNPVTATAPTASDCVVIPDVATVLNAPAIAGLGVVANAYTLDLNSNASLTVNSKNTLRVVGSVNVATSGSLVFQNDASLVQTTNAANTGNITYNRDTEPVRRYDFTYWSTPITNPAQPYKLRDLSPNTLIDKYNSYDSPTSAWDISLNGMRVMIPAVGYTVRAPQTFSITNTAIYPAVFTGIPNNGDYSVNIYPTKWSLIGNPYPSAIDAEALIDINHDASPSVDVGALYFWTHNSPPNDTPSADGSYAYTSNDYAVLNLTGSTGIGAKLPDGSFGPPPTGEIASCQSFFMKSSVLGVVKFTNDMRINGGNDQFYKTKKSKALEKNRVWLNFTNAKGAFKQVLVGYIEGASNDWDINYDANTMNGNSFIDFYSINEALKLSIQGRALPFVDTDRVPLGYKTTVAGDFTIAIDHADGLFNNQAIYLEDKTTGIVTDLRAANYTFASEIGTFVDRFTIAYTKKTLGTGDFENLENSVFVSIKDKTIKVNATKETIKEVTIYDINGQLLYNKKKVGTAELQIPNLQSSNQVLLVKVTLENDFTTTKKIIFQ